MPFKFYCRNCNQKLEAPEELYGEEIICPKCNLSIKIPDPTKLMQARPEKLSDTTMACPLCGYPRINLPAEQYGKAVCGNCHNTIPLTSPEDERLSQQLPALPDYYLVRKLGEGGSGTVYEARQIKLDNRSVAVKILNSPISTPDVLSDEISALVRLSHPYIVRIFDVVEHELTRGIVMELVTGPHCEPVSLRNILNANHMKLSPEAAVHTALTIANALEYAHRQNVLHLDLKPENILVDHLGMIRLVDFGISRFKQQPGGTKPVGQMLTAAQDVFGTPGYVAPERNMASEPPSPRMDIYSLGAVLYEMLTGKIPGGRFQLPSEIDPSMPKCLDAVIEFSLNIHPEKRYQNMTGMGEALNDALKIIRAGAGSAVPAAMASAATDNTMRIRRPDVSVYRQNAFPDSGKTTKDKTDSPYKMLGIFAGACLVVGIILIAIVSLAPGKEKPKTTNPPAATVSTTKPVPKKVAAPPQAKETPAPAIQSEQIYLEALTILSGKKGQRNINAAINLLRTAADKDYAPAINRLGEMFFYEEYGMNDSQKAVEMFRKAAGLNNAKAFYNLGECFYYGKGGVGRDYQQAVNYYQKAIGIGCREATYAMGRCYDRGHGVAQNKSQAMLLYRQAAADNYAPAKIMLTQDKTPGKS